jgi:hypothetical protein
MRPAFWKEKATVSVPAGADGVSAFFILESFKPSKSALLQGAILTWIVYSALFFAFRHSRIHQVYVPSVIEYVADPGLERPMSAPNPTPTSAHPHSRTQSVMESRTSSSTTRPPSLKKTMSSDANSSVRVSESQERATLDASGQLRRTISPAQLQSLSQPDTSTKISKGTVLSYLGKYSTDAPNMTTVLITEEDGHLAIEIPGAQKSMLVPFYGTKFTFSDTHDNWIEFTHDHNGSVYGLRIYRNCTEVRGRRITN